MCSLQYITVYINIYSIYEILLRRLFRKSMSMKSVFPLNCRIETMSSFHSRCSIVQKWNVLYTGLQCRVAWQKTIDPCGLFSNDVTKVPRCILLGSNSVSTSARHVRASGTLMSSGSGRCLSPTWRSWSTPTTATRRSRTLYTCNITSCLFVVSAHWTIQFVDCCSSLS